LKFIVYIAIAALLPGGDFCFSQAVRNDSTGGVIPFASAAAFAVDLQGNRYVLDAIQNVVVKCTPSGAPLRAVGGYGWSDVTFDQPRDISVPNGLDVYIADFGNHRIVRYDHNLNFVSTIPPGSAPEGSDLPFRYPRSIAVSRLGALYIIDGDNARIVKYSNENTVDQSFGNTGIGSARLRAPVRVRVTADDRLFIQDGSLLKVFDAFGSFVVALGEGLFRPPMQFTVDQNSVYIADSSRIYVMDGSRPIDTLMNIGQSLYRGGRDSLVDIAVFRDTLYGLTPKRITPLGPIR
jgi:hypothetical protein